MPQFGCIPGCRRLWQEPLNCRTALCTKKHLWPSTCSVLWRPLWPAINWWGVSISNQLALHLIYPSWQRTDACYSQLLNSNQLYLRHIARHQSVRATARIWDVSAWCICSYSKSYTMAAIKAMASGVAALRICCPRHSLRFILKMSDHIVLEVLLHGRQSYTPIFS